MTTRKMKKRRGKKRWIEKIIIVTGKVPKVLVSIDSSCNAPFHKLGDYSS
jgi:hypothetical protein